MLQYVTVTKCKMKKTDEKCLKSKKTVIIIIIIFPKEIV